MLFQINVNVHNVLHTCLRETTKAFLKIQSNLQHKCLTQAHECDTSATQVTHECYTKDTSATRVKNYDFDNYTSKNIFSHPYICYMTSERLQGEEQLSTNFGDASFPCQNALEKCTRKIELCKCKSSINKLYTKLQLQMPLHVPTQLRIVMQPHF